VKTGGRKAMIAAVAAAAVVFTVWGVWFSGVTASDRLRGALGVDPESIESVRHGVLERVPPGTAEADVVAYLEAHGFDNSWNYELDRSPGEVTCTVWADDSALWRSSPKGWHIRFKLDPSGRLNDVEVKEGWILL
jgi:hypothetical protein